MNHALIRKGPLSPVEVARARHRLAEAARRTGIPLATSAGTVTVKCPMPSHAHPDRTPSMRLYLDDDRFYCFGCGAKGDVVQWVQDTEGVGTLAAVHRLETGQALHNAWGSPPAIGSSPKLSSSGQPSFAPVRPEAVSFEPTRNRGGVEPPDLGRTPPARIYVALAAAWAFYTRGSLHAGGADYLVKRGIDIEVLEARTGQAEVGHTPANPVGLVLALQAKSFTADELVDAGLAHRDLSGGPLTDFYRQRVLVGVSQAV